jgi:hypothetical protein
MSSSLKVGWIEEQLALEKQKAAEKQRIGTRPSRRSGSEAQMQESRKRGGYKSNKMKQAPAIDFPEDDL